MIDKAQKFALILYLIEKLQDLFSLLVVLQVSHSHLFFNPQLFLKKHQELQLLHSSFSFHFHVNYKWWLFPFPFSFPQFLSSKQHQLVLFYGSSSILGKNKECPKGSPVFLNKMKVFTLLCLICFVPLLFPSQRRNSYTLASLIQVYFSS